jgi:tRNA (cytosine34-C5)-methyltransferase
MLSPPSSSLFEQYYSKINLFTSNSIEINNNEWEKALEVLRTPLPVSFRWNSAIDFQDKVGNQKHQGKRPLLENNISYKQLQFVDAWELNVDAKALQNDIDKKKAFRWIVAQTRSGVISRQEVASMIPVSLLNIEKNHRVLDLCASPGSKTRQALEKLCNTIAIKNDDLGIVVANDVNLKRSYIIANRCNVLGLHTQRLCVTNHKAQSFPNISIKASINKDGGDATVDGQYDRIVCDVPCSGDGTLRKDPIIWQRWHPEFSQKLHPLRKSPHFVLP